MKKRNHWTQVLALCFMVSFISLLPAITEAVSPVVEWQLGDGRLVSAMSGALGDTGVTAEVRQSSTAHGMRYDIRLRNRTGTDFTHTALRVRLPREGADVSVVIEGLTVSIPAEVHQWWEASTLQGAKHGFSYEIRGDSTSLKRVGPSVTEGEWGGRFNGIVRVDGKAYVIPEFWERQPRRITVTANEVVLTLFEGSEPLRAGEDVWDRFAILTDETLPDASVISEVEGLPDLSLAQREELMQRFGIAQEGLRGQDSETETWLRKYDQWQGTSWDKRYADDLPGRWWPGEQNSTYTTLFSLFERGNYYAVCDPGIYTWREYGDIQWNGGMSNLHYDWLRSAFKHYLRTGNRDAVRWAMAATRHAVSVDHIWPNQVYPAVNSWLNLAGLTRYEKGDHGGAVFVARQTHTWAEGMFLASLITGDPWVTEAAVDVAEGDYRVFNGDSPAYWDAAYGETRMVTWPLLVMTTAYREIGDEKYWRKAKELMDEIVRIEREQGSMGTIINPSQDVGNINNAQALGGGYAVKPMLAFADLAIQKGVWNSEYQGLLVRWATWLSTPPPAGTFFPNGNYFNPADPSVDYGTFAYFWCPPGKACTQPTSTSGDAPYNTMVTDLYAWLAVHDPAGGNRNTGQTWGQLARIAFRDSVYHAPQPYGTVGFLTNMYPTTETKALGWMQLFQDRAAMYMADSSPVPPPPPCEFTLSPTQQTFVAAGGPGTVNVSASQGCSYQSTSNVSWVTITQPASDGVVNYLVAANPGSSPRTGTLTIAGQTFTILEDGLPCTYSISPTSQQFSASAETGTVTVSATQGCAWTASSNASWITLAPESASGSGPGTVSYSVGQNAASSTRTGTITIAGQTFTATQSGASSGNPAISVTPLRLDFGRVSGKSSSTGTIKVSNVGKSPLAVNSLSLSGSGSASFKASTTCSTVGPGAFCSITVFFSPYSKGTKSANLNIYSNDPVSSPVTVRLIGTGR